jgi:shikimate dehydrogenase
VLGAGGVVPSIIFALNKMKISEIIISNRTKSKAESLKGLFKNIRTVEWGEIPEFDIIINATSVGLKNEDKMDLDISKIDKNKFFYDVIYKPSETNFLKIGKKLGNRTENGKMMFIYQALGAFKLWHGIQPKINTEVIKILD